jgi:hypothetical protein
MSRVFTAFTCFLNADVGSRYENVTMFELRLLHIITHDSID